MNNDIIFANIQHIPMLVASIRGSNNSMCAANSAEQPRLILIFKIKNSNAKSIICMLEPKTMISIKIAEDIKYEYFSVLITSNLAISESANK